MKGGLSFARTSLARWLFADFIKATADFVLAGTSDQVQLHTRCPQNSHSETNCKGKSVVLKFTEDHAGLGLT